ncbi:mucin-7-like isoform X2 [Pungitius pungitius]|uniref:mucin-7-like isoform X2 n=1 Tax=Pungitius pungitius TaxID=134920 RepID=UPI002E10AFDD
MRPHPCFSSARLPRDIFSPDEVPGENHVTETSPEQGSRVAANSSRCSGFLCDPQAKAAEEKRREMNSAFCVLLVLTGSSLTRGQVSASPAVLTPAAFPSHAGSSASPDLTEDPHNEVSQWTHSADTTSTETTTTTKATAHSEAATKAVHHVTQTPAVTSRHTNVPVAMTSPSGSTNPPPRLSTTDATAIVTVDPFGAVSSPPAHTEQETSSTARASTVQPQSESWTTAAGRPVTSAPGRGAPGQTEVPSELNVGDEDLKGPSYRSSSPLDPLLAGLLSVFIVTTAIVFVILFLKLRQRTNHPEFHRLQDLPMDDLMEDTPLSRFTY